MLNSKKSFVTSVSCILFGLALHAPAAFAKLSDDPPSLKVSFKELDLSKQAGAEELYRRITRAANAVCREAFQSPSPAFPTRNEHQKCIEAAIDNAVSEVNQPLVSALSKRQTRVASTR
ncbi:MAG TPA: UrcA family protein [Steroidobacteraceae bacterium]|jgi:UrcA family protein|nr:UrcA family protein [Steroidobacteraceae bacterium]